jgi:hypothetical protein
MLLDSEDLRAAHGPSRGALRALRAQQVEQVHLRYEAFSARCGERWTVAGRLEDADAAYVLQCGVADIPDQGHLDTVELPRSQRHGIPCVSPRMTA